MMLVSIIRFISLVFLSAWCFLLMRPFIALVLWGTVIAVTLHPVFLWLGRRLGNRPKLAAILITLVGIAVILGPFSLILKLAIDNIQTFAQNLESGTLRLPLPPAQLQDWPVIGDSLFKGWQEARNNLYEFVETYRPQLSALATKLLSLAGRAGLGILQFVLSIVIAGVLMLNAKTINNGIRRFILRLNPERGPEFMALSVATIRNVTRGVIGIAVFQTFLLSLGLFVARIPFAELLAVVCLILSIVQISPILVVLPLVIYAWSVMNVPSALVFTIWMVAAAICDNFLKPIFMAQGLSVPMLVVFIGVIGGTISHGLLGLFIGPVILSLGYELLRAWINEEDDPLAAKQV